MFKSRAAQRQLLLLNYGHSADGVPPPIWRAASRQRPPARTLPPNSPPATTSANSLRPCSTATQNLNDGTNKTPFSSPIMNAKKNAHNLRCPRLAPWLAGPIGATQASPGLRLDGDVRPSPDFTRLCDERATIKSEQLAWFEKSDLIICSASNSAPITATQRRTR